jgi:hypothetical protein
MALSEEVRSADRLAWQNPIRAGRQAGEAFECEMHSDEGDLSGMHTVAF